MGGKVVNLKGRVVDEEGSSAPAEPVDTGDNGDTEAAIDPGTVELGIRMTQATDTGEGSERENTDPGKGVKRVTSLTEAADIIGRTSEGGRLTVDRKSGFVARTGNVPGQGRVLAIVDDPVAEGETDDAVILDEPAPDSGDEGLLRNLGRAGKAFLRFMTGRKDPTGE